MLCPELERLEPLDVLWVEKHHANDCTMLMNAIGVAGQDDALEDDAIGVARLEAAWGDEKREREREREREGGG